MQFAQRRASSLACIVRASGTGHQVIRLDYAFNRYVRCKANRKRKPARAKRGQEKMRPVNMAPSKLDIVKPIPASQTPPPPKETPPASSEPVRHGRRKDDADLIPFLADEFKRYNTQIRPLHPDNRESKSTCGEIIDDQFQEFDIAKEDFLESLWDVISQHFEDSCGDNNNAEKKNTVAT